MNIKDEKDIPYYGYNLSENTNDINDIIQLKYIHKFGKAVDGHIVPPQTHTCHEIVYYGNNCSGTVTINNINYAFAPGDIAVISKNTVHSETHTGNGTLIFFGFDTKNPTILPPNGIYHNMWDMKPIINSMLCEAVNQQFNYEQILHLDIQKFLIILFRRTQAYLNTKSATTLKYIKNYLDENYAQDINFTNLAKSIGYSSGHFRRMFISAYNISPQNYLISLRCRQAIDLLKNTTMSCTDIAYQCGFSDSTQLSRLIKKNYNTTPLKIRKNNLYFDNTSSV